MKPLTKTFKPGTCLFRENDLSRELYIIQTGTVDVYRKVGSSEVVLATLKKGAVLGEMALIDGKPRSASARAATETTVIIIDSDTFYKRIKGVPAWFLSIIRTTSEKIRKANLRLQRMSPEELGGRIVILLWYLFNRKKKAGEEGAGQMPIEEAARHAVLLLGVTRQHVVRVLSMLQDARVVTLADTRIELTDVDGLRGAAHFFRRFLRRAYQKLSGDPGPIREVLFSLVESNPGLLSESTQRVEIAGGEMAPHIKKGGDSDAVLAQLTAFGIVRTRKQGEASVDSPFAEYIFSLEPGALFTWYLYCRFSPMVLAQ